MDMLLFAFWEISTKKCVAVIFSSSRQSAHAHIKSIISKMWYIILLYRDTKLTHQCTHVSHELCMISLGFAICVTPHGMISLLLFALHTM